MIFGSRLLEDSPEVGHAVVRAIAKAAERLQDPDYRNDPEIVKALTEVGGFTAEDVTTNAVAGFREDLSFQEDSLKTLQESYLRADLLDYDEPVAFDELIDDDFREAAVASRSTCGD
jgi:hypothetical protein